MGCAPCKIISLYNSTKKGIASIPPEIITFSPGLTNTEYLTANCANLLVLKSTGILF